MSIDCEDVITSKMYEVKIINFFNTGEYVIYQATIRNLTSTSTHMIYFRYKTLKRFH